MTKVSSIVIAHNSEQLLAGCLESLTWSDEVLVIDSGSRDKTVSLAKEKGAKVILTEKKAFSKKRNLGAEEASGEWLFYLDDDERVTPELKKEIQRAIESNVYTSYIIPRKNILLGKEMKHGGWWPDHVHRLMRKESLVGWEGELHEQPRVKGRKGRLKSPLVHHTHRSLSEMVEKTNKWSNIEARLLFQAGHPRVVWWRFISAAFREFWYRGIKKKGFLDGGVGIIEIIYQMYSRMITYAKLWELQIQK